MFACGGSHVTEAHDLGLYCHILKISSWTFCSTLTVPRRISLEILLACLLSTTVHLFTERFALFLKNAARLVVNAKRRPT